MSVIVSDGRAFCGRREMNLGHGWHCGSYLLFPMDLKWLLLNLLFSLMSCAVWIQSSAMSPDQAISETAAHVVARGVFGCTHACFCARPVCFVVFFSVLFSPFSHNSVIIYLQSSVKQYETFILFTPTLGISLRHNVDPSIYIQISS